jgi:SAM-dependent methyltransferase
MRNRNTWMPSKYVRQNGRLVASRDSEEVGVASRLIADVTARFYETNLKIHAKGRLLDLGCGKVPLFDAYRHYVTDNICIDWENTAWKNDHLDFEADLSKELPFADGEFDTIILSDVLEHIAEPERLCGEIARVLSPKGKLLMNVPFYYMLHEQPHDYYRFTEFALRRFMDRSGMQILQLQAMGGAPEVMLDVFSKNVMHVPVAGVPVATVSHWVTSALIHTSVGRRISEATARNFPLGYFLVAVKPGVAPHDGLD